MCVGLKENYQETAVYYHCGDIACPGYRDPHVHAPSKALGTSRQYDFEVMAKICELRWTKHLTHTEIVDQMKIEYGVIIDDSSVGNVLKIYEIGCTGKYKQSTIDDIRAFGGVIITIDAMEPLKGERAVYRARDYRTDLTLGARLMPNQKLKTIEDFLKNVKERVEKELGVPILGIVSDALVVQRMAIESVFPGVPHCLCHFHFYDLVLDNAKEVDSALLTSIRSVLNGLTDVQKFKEAAKVRMNHVTHGGFIDEIIAALSALSSWSRRPKDPVFTGLEMHDRVLDIVSVLDAAIKEIGRGIFPVVDERRLLRIREHVVTCIDENKTRIEGLHRIKEHLSGIKAILDDESASKEKSIAAIEKYNQLLNKRLETSDCGEIERTFIKAFARYVETKSEQLFNYKIVPGAPKTNNGHELCHKQLKHLLRRIIGAKAASAYLLAHGDRITYVNPRESFDEIVKIISTMDINSASRIIKQERRSREMLTLVMHDPQRWEKRVLNLREILSHLKEQISIRA